MEPLDLKKAHTQPTLNVTAVNPVETEQNAPPTHQQPTVSCAVVERPNVFSGESSSYDKFIEEILSSVIGRNPRTIEKLKISVSDIQNLNPKLTLSSSHPDDTGKTITLTYNFSYSDNGFQPPEVEKSEGKIEKTFYIPKNLQESDLEKLKDGLRSLFIADPLLNRRFVSNLPFNLEPFQQEAVSAGLEGFQNKGSSLIVMPTGTGKTEVAWTILDEHLSRLEERKKKAIFIVNNRLILDDAEKKLKRRFGDKYTTSKIYDQVADFSGDVIFATPVSLSNKMTDLFKYLKEQDQQIDMFIYDEVHHLPAESFSETLRSLKSRSESESWNSVHAGFSATPERMDRLDVLRFFGNKIDFEFPIDKGWSMGFLAPLDIVLADNDINPEDVVPVLPDSRLGGLYRRMIADEERLAKLPEVYKKDLVQTGKEGKSLIIVKDNDTAEKVAANFRKKGYSAIALTSRQKDSSYNIEYGPEYFDHHYTAWKFGEWPKDSKYSSKPVPKIAVAVDMFKEGVDVPDISRLILARYTNSLGTFLQTVGRGLRPAPLKQNLRLVDFVGQLRNLNVMQFFSNCGSTFTDLREAGSRDPKKEALEEDIDFNGGYVNSIKEFMENIPYLLERRYITYENIIDPRELKKLDFFFAKKLGANTDNEADAQNFLNKFLEGFFNEVQSSNCDINKLRASIYPLICFAENDPQGLRLNKPWILDGANQIIYRHLISKLNQVCINQNQELNIDNIDSILPEFSEKRSQQLKNMAQNIKFLRQKILRLSREDLFKVLGANNNLAQRQDYNTDLIRQICHSFLNPEEVSRIIFNNNMLTVQANYRKSLFFDVNQLKSSSLWDQIIKIIKNERNLSADNGKVSFYDLTEAIQNHDLELWRTLTGFSLDDLASLLKIVETGKSEWNVEGIRNESDTQNLVVDQRFIDTMVDFFLSYTPLENAGVIEADFFEEPEKFKELMGSKGVYKGALNRNIFINQFNDKIKKLYESVKSYNPKAEASIYDFQKTLLDLEEFINSKKIEELDLDDLDTRNMNRLKNMYQNLRSEIDNSNLESDDVRRIYDALNIIYRPVFVVDEMDLGENKKAILTRSESNTDSSKRENKYNVDILDCEANSKVDVFTLWNQDQIKFEFSSQPNKLGDIALIIKPDLTSNNSLQIFCSKSNETARNKTYAALLKFFETIGDNSNRKVSVILPVQDDTQNDNAFMSNFAEYIHKNSNLDLMAGIELGTLGMFVHYLVKNNRYIHLFRTSHSLEALRHLKGTDNSIFKVFANLGIYKKLYEPPMEELLGSLENYLSEEPTIKLSFKAASDLKIRLSLMPFWVILKNSNNLRLLTEKHFFSGKNEISEEYINYGYLRLMGSESIFINDVNLLHDASPLNSTLNDYLDLKKYTLENPNENNLALLNEANILFKDLVNANTGERSLPNSVQRLKELNQKIKTELSNRPKETNVVKKATVPKSQDSIIIPPYINQDNKIVLWITKVKKGNSGEFHWDPNCTKVTEPGTKIVQQGLTNDIYYFQRGKCMSCEQCRTPPLRALEEMEKRSVTKLLQEDPRRRIQN